MRCWKCKSEMPEGVKYCGNCGVHMNRAVHMFQWLFSKKGIPVLILILALIIGAAAWYIIPKIRIPTIDIDLDMGWYAPREEDIVYEDEEKTFGYVSNMILIFFTKDATVEEISEVINSVDGEVVGVLPGVGQYQIRVERSTEEELEAMRKQLMEFDVVKNAVIDYVTTVESDVSIPNDPWADTPNYGFSSDWDENNPDGTNWWAEATKLPSAWEYQEFLSHILVGVVDNGFDAGHEDLNLVILNEDVNNAEGHGSHVAGIMGAIADNGVGITGVLKDCTIYCVDCYATEEQEAQRISISSLLAGIDLCLYNDCRVVNMSSGMYFDYASRNPAGVEKTARNAITYLIMMIDAYDRDFIVVQSAGNGDNNSLGVDACRYNGYFASITPELVQAVLDEMKADDVKLEKEITVEDVMNSLMVVASVDMERKDGSYQLAESSNYGESVTVCAPGVRILSTVPHGNEYAYYNGTSMAAPLAASITAMVWSVDQELSNAEIKEIVVSTAQEPVLARGARDVGTYYLINAKAAVEKALDVAAQKETQPSEPGDASEPVKTGRPDKLIPFFDRYVGKENYKMIQSNLVTETDGTEYYWDVGTVDDSAEAYVTSYMNLILDDEYQFELLHEADGEYFYTYTGTGDVDPLGQHQGMSMKMDDCYLWIKLTDEGDKIRYECWCSANFDFVEVERQLNFRMAADLPDRIVMKEAGVLSTEYIFRYTSLGQIEEITTVYYNPDGSVNATEYLTFRYNDKGWLIGYTDTGVNSDSTYTYDDEGRLLSEVKTGDYENECVYYYDEEGNSTGYCLTDSEKRITGTYEELDESRTLVHCVTFYNDGSEPVTESWVWSYNSDGQMEEVVYEYTDSTMIERIDRSFRTFVIRGYEDSSGLSYFNLDLDLNLGTEFFSTFFSLYLKEYQLQCESGLITFISDPAYDRTYTITYLD